VHKKILDTPTPDYEAALQINPNHAMPETTLKTLAGRTRGLGTDKAASV
jgi:hypothetical protein